MIAFIFDVNNTKFWVENIMMAPNESDVIINQEGERFSVVFRIISFNEKIGTHYGIIVVPFADRDWPLREEAVAAFQESVTETVFRDMPNFALPSVEEGGEEPVTREW